MGLSTIELGQLDVTGTGLLVELLSDDGTNDDVLLCAAHGGRIEPGTAEQAMELAARLRRATCWARLGYDETAEEFERWHPPSTSIDPVDHPLLGEIEDRGFTTVISFHGLADSGLIVGGGIDADGKHRVRDRLARAVSADVRTVSSGPYAGTSPANFVNWLASDRDGLQLEQGPDVRDAEAGVVVDVLETLIDDGVI